MQALKVVVVGDKAVGKSALISRMRGEPYESAYQETIGINLQVLTRGDTRLHIWDLAGDELFEWIAKENMRGANIVLLCLDVSRADVADQFTTHFERIREAAAGVKVIVVATKADIANAVDIEASSELAQRMESAGCCFGPKTLTSAKNGTGVDSLSDEMFKIARSLSPQKPRDEYNTEEETNSDMQLPPHSGMREPDEDGCFAAFFFQVAQHTATGVIGGLLMLAGLSALGIGIACLCPALIPVMAGIGIVLSQSVATTAVIAGGSAAVVGTMATFFHKQATGMNVAGVGFDDIGERVSETEEHDRELSGEFSHGSYQ